MKKMKKVYCAPEAEVVPVALQELLCASAGAGSNEDLDFEDWDIDG